MDYASYKPGIWSGLAIAAGLFLTTSAVAQFTAPYSGVKAKTRTTPLPVVVMMYEPSSPFDHLRMSVFGRYGNSVVQVAKDRDDTWYKRITMALPGSVVPADDPVPFRSPDGRTASVFVLGTNSVVYQAISRREAYFGTWTNWSSLPTNVAMSSTAVAVNTPDGTGASAFARGHDGYVYNAFYSRTSSTWGAWSRVPNSPVVTGRPAVVNSSDGKELHIFATDSGGVLRHCRFVRGGSGGWTAWTAVSSTRVLGAPSCYALGSLVSVFATGQDGVVRQALYSSGRWGTMSNLDGRNDFASGPSAVNSPDGTQLDVIARTKSGLLYAKTYKRGSGGGWSNWTAWQVGSFSAAPTLANWHTRTMTVAEARQQVFGANDSVTAWMKENSFGKFQLQEAFISNWLTMPDDPTTTIDESSYEFFHGPDYARKAQLMVQGFEKLTSFRFNRYDTNHDGKVTIDELMVYWIYPGRGARVRGAPTSIPVSSGVSVSLSLGLPRSAAHTAPATITEELCHALFGLDDLYETKDLPSYVGPGKLSLISNNTHFPHLHPWGKMKLGWVAPRVVTRDGWYDLRAIEKHPDLLVVHDPARGPRDYFLVENRWPDGSIERTLPDRGIAVWRISEHFEKQSHWGRKTIKLLRAGGGKDDSVAFWDKRDTGTAYHLTPTSGPATTLWYDNANSHIAIYHFPSAGPTSRVYVDIPPLRSTPPRAYLAPSFRYIDQRTPYKNPSTPWMLVGDLPKIGTAFRTRVPKSYFYGGKPATHIYVLGWQNPNTPFPALNGYAYTTFDSFQMMPFGQVSEYTDVSLPIPDTETLLGLRFYQQVFRIGPGTNHGSSRGGELVIGSR
ncbi:MAG: hypothetical protein KDC95_04480 [Planctomycetes bacterium]|nr:hypothetical protein [Planctomycetota bacterium]